MSTDQDNGKLWINTTLQGLAAERALTIDRAEWHRSVDDVKAGAESLILEAGGRRFIERFRLADIEDIPGDSGVRSEVAHYLVGLMERIADDSHGQP